MGLCSPVLWGRPPNLGPLAAPLVSAEPSGAKTPVNRKGSKEGCVGSLPLGLPQTGQGPSRGVSSSLGVIAAVWATELLPASLPRNLVLDRKSVV